MKTVVLLGLAIASLAVIGLYQAQNSSTFEESNADPIVPIPSINVPEYVGLWYEIGSIPFFWSINCYGTTVITPHPRILSRFFHFFLPPYSNVALLLY